MKYTDVLNIVSKGYTNLKKIISFSEALGHIELLCRKKKAPYSAVVRAVINKMGGDWYDTEEIFINVPAGDFLVGQRYGIIAGLAMLSVKDTLAIIDVTDEDVLLKPLINSIRVSLLIYCSNLFKAIDVFTGVYSSYKIDLYIKELVGVYSDSDGRGELISVLQERGKLSNDVLSAVRESGFSPDEFYQITREASNRLIVSELVIDDALLYSKYCTEVSPEAIDILEEYLYILTRTDIIKLMETPTEGQALVAEELGDKLSQTISEMSIIEDYQLLFEKIAVNETNIIKLTDITSLSVEVFEDAIIKSTFTDELRENITGRSKFVEAELGSFNG